VSRSSVAALAAAIATLTPAAAWAATTTTQPTPPTSLSAPTPSADALAGRAPLAEQARVEGQSLAERTRRALARRAAARAAARQAPSSDPRLAAIRMCESHGNYATNTGNGFYGGYQFTLQTWQSVGGKGLPSSAPPAEQDRRALMLLERSGSSPWPVCGV
jgi:hypothetical protein